ncbi:MAG: LacI family DNA-binding transcriptional regulator [Sedimentisphaerales bacterium]|nr:LacI family DNA-binding transcriptional regulator [Sedimentisphaerales bacterium]
MGKLTENIVLEKSRSKKLPLYQQIREQLQKKIISNDFKEGETLPSISYLAKKWNVTYRTIKAAYKLLEEDGLIDTETRKQVRVIPRHVNAADSQIKKHSFVYITCHHDDAYYSIAYDGVRRFFIENNLELVLIDVGASRKRFIEAVSNPGEDITGLLVLPFETPGYEDAVRKTIAAGRKVVFFDRHLPHLEASSVEADHYSVAYQATTHLLALHNMPVYYLAFVSQPSGARDWFKGWGNAMGSHGYTNLKPYIFDFPVAEEKLANTMDIGLEYSIKAALDLFNTRKEKTYCIFSGNDFIARGVYIAAQQRGLQIGKDVFIVGSGNLPFAEKMPVPLSSVQTLPTTQDLGYQAAKLLFEHITGVVKHPVRRLLPVELIVRESSSGKQQRTR